MRIERPLLAIALVALALALASSGVARAEDSLKVINLGHRQAESVIPMLREMYGRDKAVISGSGTKLFVKAEPATVAEIRKLVGALDVKPRMLRIAIRGGGIATAQSRSLGARVQGGLDPKPVVKGVQLRAVDNASSSQSNGERFIMVEEGMPASLGDASDTRVVAHVEGDQVRVEVLSATRPPNVVNAPGAPPTAPVARQTSSVGTTAGGSVGEWLPVGGGAQSSEHWSSGILQRDSGSERSTSSAQIKVDVVR
ncbi:MAG: hypothetical protein HY075_11820 [Deltaproteobacteria bacterium]|nr:hypothetical protein [Deltaproteobacteria bacterium]